MAGEGKVPLDWRFVLRCGICVNWEIYCYKYMWEPQTDSQTTPSMYVLCALYVLVRMCS